MLFIIDRSLANDFLEIYVGYDSVEQFFIHSILICETSDYFKTALEDKWQESETRKFHLTDHTPEAFRVYVMWLYSKRVHSKFQVPKAYEKRWGTAGLLMLLVDAYLLGQYL